MKIFGLVGLLFFVSACASTQKVETPKLNPTVYSKSVYSVTLSQMQSFDCPKTQKDEGHFKKTEWRELVSVASACVKAERWSQVEILGNLLAVRESDAPWGTYFLSLAAEARSERERALWMISLAIKKSPNLGILHFQKGRLLWQDHSYSAAVNELIFAVQNDGSLIDAHLFLGQIFFRDQDYSKAAQHFFIVLKVRPNDPVALSGLAESRLQSNDTAGAVAALKRAVQAHPDRVDFILREAYIYEVILNERENALGAYKAALQIIDSKKLKTAAANDLVRKVAELEKLRRSPSAIAERPIKKPEVKQ